MQSVGDEGVRYYKEVKLLKGQQIVHVCGHEGVGVEVLEVQ